MYLKKTKKKERIPKYQNIDIKICLRKTDKN